MTTLHDHTVCCKNVKVKSPGALTVIIDRVVLISISRCKVLKTLYILIFIIVLGLFNMFLYVLSSHVLSFVCLAFCLLCYVSCMSILGTCKWSVNPMCSVTSSLNFNSWQMLWAVDQMSPTVCIINWCRKDRRLRRPWHTAVAATTQTYDFVTSSPSF